jgi:ABC-type nickel/cobalt efflux system permease component RcnA
MIILAMGLGGLLGTLLAVICSSIGISFNVSAWAGISLSAAVAAVLAVHWERKSVRRKLLKVQLPVNVTEQE